GCGPRWGWCWSWLVHLLCRVVGVDVDVLGGEVAAPGVPLGVADPELDVDVDARAAEDGTHALQVGVAGPAVGEHCDIPDAHRAAVEGEAGPAAPHGGDDASPVGIASVDRGLHQRAARDRP